MARLPHQRDAAQFRHAIVQCLTGLYVRDDRRTGQFLQHRLCINRQQLIAPDHPTFAIDGANTVTIAIECHAEVELLVGNQRLEIDEVLFLGRVGVMIGKIAVNVGKQGVMLTRQQLDELLDDRPGHAIPGVPANTIGCTVEAFDQSRDILIHDLDAFRPGSAVVPIAVCRHRAELLDIGAKERTVLKPL